MHPVSMSAVTSIARVVSGFVMVTGMSSCRRLPDPLTTLKYVGPYVMTRMALLFVLGSTTRCVLTCFCLLEGELSTGSRLPRFCVEDAPSVEVGTYCSASCAGDTIMGSRFSICNDAKQFESGSPILCVASTGFGKKRKKRYHTKGRYHSPGCHRSVLL